jgi:predicted dehydrogenase
MSKDKLTRRNFVAGTASASVGAMILPRHVLGGTGYKAPSDKLNVAIVGCGGQGAADGAELVQGGENIVALADVDFGYVDTAVAKSTKTRDGKPNPERIKLQEAYGKAKRYDDFRKMLEQQKDIDAVLVATPDHIHAIAAKTAMEMGKHVYCEKPLTWSVQEARVLRETAARNPKLVTQMGNQGHSSEEARLICEWIQAGVLGQVKEVYVWTNRPRGYWPQGISRPYKPEATPEASQFGTEWTQNRINRETAAMMMSDVRLPSTLNWDLYLGPAAEIPYHPVYHPFNWRGWVDFGTGALGDMAAHLLDHPYWALGLKYPSSVEATFTPWGLDEKKKPATYPLASQVVYHFPARGAQSPVRLVWLDGGLMAPRPAALPENVPLQGDGGVIFIGEKGILMHETYGKKPQLFPESLREEAKKVPQKYERVITNEKKDALHRINWANACKSNGKSSTPFEYAGRLTETMLLGVVALRTGAGVQLRYDGDAGRIVNNDNANQFLAREYRTGWKLM